MSYGNRHAKRKYGKDKLIVKEEPARCPKWDNKGTITHTNAAINFVNSSTVYWLSPHFRHSMLWKDDCIDEGMMQSSFSTTLAHVFFVQDPPRLSAWENGDMSVELTRRLSPHAKVAAIMVMVVALALATWLTPVHLLVLHNILHHLNILPLMLAGMLFGWRGALQALLLATVLQSPSIYRHWHTMPLDAQDQVVELSTFGAAGLIAGVVADRERMQRRRVESTKLELERVYTELRENIQQMKKTERLTAAGQLAASLAHEIRNPLASISGAAGILARGQAPASSREECLDILMKESLRLNKLLTNFLDFARPRLPRFQWTEPVSVIQSVTVLTQHLAARQDVMLIQRTPPQLRQIECDPEQIKQVLLNLILNAVQASDANASVVISCLTTKEHLQIEVADQGRGISTEDADRIFDPFFTTKENGTGLGLAVAANIIAQHGGAITCHANRDHETGTIFRVELPFQRSEKTALHNLHHQATSV